MVEGEATTLRVGSLAVLGSVLCLVSGMMSDAEIENIAVVILKGTSISRTPMNAHQPTKLGEVLEWNLETKFHMICLIE